MTHFTRWLFYIGLFAVPYICIVLGLIRSSITDEWMFGVKVSPIILIILFGIYSASTVLYRTFTFNDCPEAAIELQKQITEARKDLISKGFIFRD